MADIDKVVLKPVEVNGRTLVFRPPTMIQIAMLHRLRKILTAVGAQLDTLEKEKAADDDSRVLNAATDGMEAVAKVLDMFASLVAPDVSEWLVNEMLTGKIDDEDILRIMREITPDEAAPAKAPVRKSARRT